ncbi:hypothetical protein [Zooshikella ganghwensis]|uniref:hypothetical protein n=1 Tax=Zooshikella ganghwensis TaxID=202772 RepID=UPI0012F7088C|nr:hypothetical protein [Zooshikella ganghwensis]
MPLDLRLAYFNEIYDIASVFIGVKQIDNSDLCSQSMAAALTKENMEAQPSVIQLGTNPTHEAIRSAHRELKESAATAQSAVDVLEKRYEKVLLNQKQKSCSQSVGVKQLSGSNQNGGNYEHG